MREGSVVYYQVGMDFIHRAEGWDKEVANMGEWGRDARKWFTDGDLTLYYFTDKQGNAGMKPGHLSDHYGFRLEKNPDGQWG